MEYNFEKLDQNVEKVLQLLQRVPEARGFEEILKDVKDIPQITKILEGRESYLFSGLF